MSKFYLETSQLHYIYCNKNKKPGAIQALHHTVSWMDIFSVGPLRQMVAVKTDLVKSVSDP